MIKFTSLVVVLTFLIGCKVSTGENMKYSLLRVQNDSPKDIFVSLVSKEFTESFGGIPPGKSAGIGFSPLRFGDETIIHYSEDTIEENEEFIINTKSLSGYGGGIDEVIFRYLGNGEWILNVLDQNGKLIDMNAR